METQIINRELGAREKLTLTLPYDARNLEHINAVLRAKRRLSCDFGGYTAVPFEGGWVADGALLIERGERIEVSYPCRYCAPVGHRAHALNIFAEVGAACGQEWLHIERSEFNAEHRQIRATANGYRNEIAQQPPGERSPERGGPGALRGASMENVRR